MLAKLRGKKPKKAPHAGDRGVNFRTKVSPTAGPPAAAATDPQSGRAFRIGVPVAAEQDAAPAGGKQGWCVNGGVVLAVSGDGDERTDRAREQLACGDSIGFGNVSWDGPGLIHDHRGPVEWAETAGRDGAVVLDQGATSVSLGPGAEFGCVRGHLLDKESPGLLHLLQTNEEDLDLIRTVEGDLRMPVLQSPTFFPTELEIVDASTAPRLVWDREGSSRHDSVDSEDEDYYDNEILPFYESGSQNLDSAAQPLSVHIVRSGQDTGSAQETDRLRTQLKEAYYLLISTMHGMALDSPAHSDASSQSRDSMRSASCSSGQHSDQQAGGSHWALPDLGPACGARFGSTHSGSSHCLASEGSRPLLRRCLSDSGVRYSTGQGVLGVVPPRGSSPDAPVSVTGPRAEGAGCVGDSEDVGETQSRGDPCSSLVDRCCGEQAEGRTVPVSESAGVIGCLVGSADSPDAPARKAGQQLLSSSTLAKPPGVTVNKMQEWMHRGRVLSTEMRQRIAGSSVRGPQGRDGKAWPRTSGHSASTANTAKLANTGHGGPQPGMAASEGQRSVPNSRSSPHPFSLSSFTFSQKDLKLQKWFLTFY